MDLEPVEPTSSTGSDWNPVGKIGEISYCLAYTVIQNFRSESNRFQPVPIGTCGAQQRPLGNYGGDCGEGVVRGISFNNRLVQDAVSENGSHGKGFLQQIEGFLSLIGKLEWDPFTGEAGERDNDIGVVENDVSVEIGEAEEGLNVSNFPQLRPILYGLNLCLCKGYCGRAGRGAECGTSRGSKEDKDPPAGVG